MIDSLAIGRFDGLHLGHQELFKKLGENGGILLIETKKSNLTPPESLGRYTKLPVFIYELETIRSLSAEEFVAKIEADFVELKKIVIGEDFRFAVNRSAGAMQLRKLFCGETVIMPELKINNIGVHSRYIRSLLLSGKIREANLYLGREYEICGRIVKGQGIGAQKLVATINLSVNAYILPKEGVYATKTECDNIAYRSVTFVGHRVSTDGSFAVETHILDSFEGCLDDIVFVSFVEKIRDNRYFEGIEELKRAIYSDIESAKKILAQ
ncbi:MAG TPA: bifunctional riboflavin kinase/FAD synthetase [Campylobacterales bacterium]|nr:bifunctional riboflavin kinase/FAD synthetase [Campylobacterales bacterium]